MRKEQASQNKDRAEAGKVAVAAMVKHVDNSDLDEMVPGDVRAAIVDTLANVLHYGESRGVYAREVIWTAKDHFNAEMKGDD